MEINNGYVSTGLWVTYFGSNLWVFRSKSENLDRLDEIWHEGAPRFSLPNFAKIGPRWAFEGPKTQKSPHPSNRISGFPGEIKSWGDMFHVFGQTPPLPPICTNFGVCVQLGICKPLIARLVAHAKVANSYSNRLRNLDFVRVDFWPGSLKVGRLHKAKNNVIRGFIRNMHLPETALE